MISKRKASPPTSTWRASRPYRPRWGIRGSGLFSFNESHDTMIYFKICCHLFSFLTLLFVSRTKQQGLEVSARKPLPLFCMLILKCVFCDVISLCAAGSYPDCFVMSELQSSPKKVNASLLADSSMKDGRVIGSWSLWCDSAGQTMPAWVSQAVINGRWSIQNNYLESKLC